MADKGYDTRDFIPNAGTCSIDNAIVQETTYQTSNVTAEVSSGSVHTNMAPKDDERAAAAWDSIDGPIQ